MANEMPNIVKYGNRTVIDLTDTTATASDVASGKYFYGADGKKTEGTGSSSVTTIVDTPDGNGGTIRTITTDAVTLQNLDVTANDTYTALSGVAYNSVGVNVSGGGGLVYEEGTWTPTEDIESYVISFSNTHTEAPFHYEISDATGTYDDTTNTNYRLSYTCWQKIFGEGMCPSSLQTNNGIANIIYRASNTTNFSSSNVTITEPYDATGSTTTYPRYWATETGIKAYGNSTSRYWRTGRTYKWIAVWAPTS